MSAALPLLQLLLAHAFLLLLLLLPSQVYLQQEADSMLLPATHEKTSAPSPGRLLRNQLRLFPLVPLLLLLLLLLLILPLPVQQGPLGPSCPCE